jgi:hypothetical protein
MARALVQSNFIPTPQITIRTDFDTSSPVAPTSSSAGGGGAAWDVAHWDVDVWPPESVLQNTWQNAAAFGEVVSPVYQVTVSQSSSVTLRLTAMELLYEKGNAFG